METSKNNDIGDNSEENYPDHLKDDTEASNSIQEEQDTKDNNPSASMPLDSNTEKLESPQSQDNSKDKKPFYKKTWFIVIVVIIVLSAIGSLGSGNSSSSTDSASSETISETSDEPETQEVDKSELQGTLDTATATTNDGYTDESWQALQDAISAGQTVIQDNDATQEEVDDAESSITNALISLEVAFNPDNYQWPAYEDVARTPDDWSGQKVAFSGKVLQVIEGSDEIDLRVATDGEYDDVILVGYSPDLLNGTRVLEDDNITVYGTCIGLYTYTSTMGASISIPGVYADQITIN